MPRSEMFKFFGARVAASPQMCRAILRLLAAQGPLPVGELGKALLPEGITDPLESQYQLSLEIVRELKLVVGVETYSLNEDFVLAGGDLAGFRIGFRQALNRHAMDEINVGAQPSDLFQGLLWMGMQPHTSSWTATSDLDVQRPLDDLGFRSAIMNTEQWRGFRDWSRALGFGREMVGSQFVPYFTTAVSDALIGLTGEYTVRSFVDSIAQSVPLLHDVSVRSWYSDTRRGADLDRAAPALSWALARLQASGRLACSSKDDADDQWDLSAPVGLVSHVRVMV